MLDFRQAVHGGAGGSVLLALLVPLVAACHDERIDARRVVLRNEGALCVGPAPVTEGEDAATPVAGVDVGAGQPLAIAVRSGCLSNICATARSAKCSVKRDGDRLLVTSELGWLGPEDIGAPCPQKCTVLDAQCTTEALPAGTYKVVLGSRIRELTLPSHLDVRCDSDRPKSIVAAPLVAPSATPTAGLATHATNMDPSAVPAAPGTGVVAAAPPGDTICIGPSAAGKNRALRTGQPIVITVLHQNACVGSSCTRAPAKCTAKRKGSQIVVSAQFPSSTTKPTAPCTEDCNAMAATCRTDGLPAGTYTLEIGTQRKTIQIPAASAPACGP